MIESNRNIVEESVVKYYNPLLITNPHTNHKDTLRVLSLFSGCGGMDIGLEGGFIAHRRAIEDDRTLITSPIDQKWVRVKPTRFQTIFANDIIRENQTAWERYMQMSGKEYNTYRLGSIVELVKLHEEGLNIFPPDIDLVSGGFPCQDFSVAGKRKGFKSDVSHIGRNTLPDSNEIESRGMLYYWMKRVIDIVQPKLFIAENVKGLTNLGDALKTIRNDFSRAGNSGYIVVEPQILNAADYGVAQSRERVFFIGFRRDALLPEALSALQQKHIPAEYNPYPPHTHGFTTNSKKLKKPLTTEEIFADLEEPESSTDLSHFFYSKAKFLGKRGQGQTEVPTKGVSPTIRSEHHGNIEYRRLSRENGGAKYDELNQGLLERRLTPRECALLQSFPPNYEFVIRKKNGRGFTISPSVAYRIIGNAVPPLLAYNIGKHLDSKWDKYFL